jgi:hypothetical protein
LFAAGQDKANGVSQSINGKVNFGRKAAHRTS